MENHYKQTMTRSADQMPKEKNIIKKIFPVIAAAAVAFGPGDKGAQKAQAEGLRDQPTIEQFHGPSVEKGENNSAQELVNIIKGLYSAQADVPKALEDPIRKEAFGMASLIEQYGHLPIAPAVLEIILDEYPTALFRALNYLENTSWAQNLLERLLLETPKSSEDTSLRKSAHILNSADPRIQQFLLLPQNNSVLLLDDIVKGALSVKQAIALANRSENAFISRLATIALRKDSLGAIDVNAELLQFSQRTIEKLNLAQDQLPAQRIEFLRGLSVEALIALAVYGERDMQAPTFHSIFDAYLKEIRKDMTIEQFGHEEDVKSFALMCKTHGRFDEFLKGFDEKNQSLILELTKE